MLGLAHFSLEECADMYRRFGSEVFRQNPLVGTVKMGWNHSYYDTETWEKILQYAQNNSLQQQIFHNEFNFREPHYTELPASSPISMAAA